MKNLSEMASALARLHPELTVTKAQSYLRSTFDLIAKGLHELPRGTRDRVSIDGFGTLGVKDQPARQVRHIRTGEMVDVPASIRISFKASEKLMKSVKDGVELEIPERPARASEGEASPEHEVSVEEAEHADVDTSKVPDLDI